MPSRNQRYYIKYKFRILEPVEILGTFCNWNFDILMTCAQPQVYFK